MRLLAMDPSYSGLGIVVLENNKLKFLTCSSESGDLCCFFDYFVRAIGLRESVMDFAGGARFDAMITEEPLPVGAMSGALYGLDFLLLDELCLLSDIMYCVNPSFLRCVIGSKKYKRSDIRRVSCDLLNVFYSFGYEVEAASGRRSLLSIDESCALIFLSYLSVFLNFDKSLAEGLCRVSNVFSDKSKLGVYDGSKKTG